MKAPRILPTLSIVLTLAILGVGRSHADSSPGGASALRCPCHPGQNTADPPRFDRHVLWSYGTGNRGVGEGELSGPHSAEENPLNPDEIVVSEQYGNDILLINRRTGAMRVLYGERGVPGRGKRLHAAHSAHFMPAGPFQGHVLITEYQGDHRVMIIDRNDGEVLWSYHGLEKPLEAIYWDEAHIMASDQDHGVFKIRLSDQAKVWEYDSQPHGHPFYLQNLAVKPVHDPQFRMRNDSSYGGDLLIGYWGPYPVVREIDTRTKKTIWLYGQHREHGQGDLWDRLYTPVRGFRYGMNERGGGVTIIVDERARIFAVNRDKELLWDLGGSSGGDLLIATPYALLPTYISATTRGTLLVTDWGRNMIYEINPFHIPPRTAKDAYLFTDYATEDEFADSGIMESRGYSQKLIQVYNKQDAHRVVWRVLGSHNTKDWQVIHAPSEPVAPAQGAHVAIRGPWNYLKVQAKSSKPGNSTRFDAYITLRR